jgi:hypothetical protein
MDAVEIVLLGLSVMGSIGEALSLCPWFKANGICQAVYGIVKALSGKSK